MNKIYNSLDKQYTDLLQDIIDNGVKKSDRTGTGTISVFGRQIRHNMKEGFPLLTTKKMSYKSVVAELIWFLRGDTNIRYLVENGCNIWNGDAYKRYANYDCAIKWLFNKAGKEPCPVDGPFWRHYTMEEFIDKIKTDDEFADTWGDLGPIYGAQWRNWGGYDYHGDETVTKQIDQIANLINDLKTNPDSRRLMVNAWNVGEINDMVLPPCHYGFQCYTRELTIRERMFICNGNNDEYDEAINNQELKDYNIDVEAALFVRLNELNIPKRALSLMWNQRSVDTFLGLPFNIASYALLLEMIAKEVNMVPDQLIGNLGDVHLYTNHIEQAKEQIGVKMTQNQRFNHWFHVNKPNRDVVEHYEILSMIGRDIMLDESRVPKFTREPFELPSITISNKEIKDIGEYNIEDVTLNNYKSHEAIKAPLSN